MTVQYIKYIININGPVKSSLDAVYSILQYKFVISCIINYKKISSAKGYQRKYQRKYQGKYHRKYQGKYHRKY